jgi:acetylornithine deacetylase/succinyl-diaminopimelate desuccinylase-like protein
MGSNAALDARPAEPPATRLKHRHLLGIADLTPEEIVLILDTAEAMQEIAHRPIKKVPTLRGRTVVNLFFEPSTRTRTSFEVAEKRLSADTLNVAIATSSVVKGETLVDTALNLEAMSPDMIVLRHASSGACHLLARVCRSKIINAGDDPVVSTQDSPLYRALESAVKRQHPEAIVTPMTVPYGTDGNSFRPKGVKAYGFFPARALDPETAARLIHSADERVPVEDLELGVDFLRSSAKSLLSNS